jgi:hypothetical protein
MFYLKVLISYFEMKTSSTFCITKSIFIITSSVIYINVLTNDFLHDKIPA